MGSELRVFISLDFYDHVQTGSFKIGLSNTLNWWDIILCHSLFLKRQMAALGIGVVKIQNMVNMTLLTSYFAFFTVH